MHLLMVEGDAEVRHRVATRLERHAIDVTATETSSAALIELEHRAFDVAIFDLMSPDGSGLDLLSVLRKRRVPTHVIIVGDAAEERDRVRALELGADDYVVKPFSVRELAARVLAVRRRQGPEQDNRLEYGSIVVDIAAREVTIGDERINLTAKEFDLLAFLAARPRYAFSRDELLHSVWQSAADWQQESTVTEHVRRLRGKIEVDPQRPVFLQTVRGVGYRFDPPEETEPTDDVEVATVVAVTVEEGKLVLVDGRIVAADTAALEMVGVAHESDLVGREVFELVAPQSRTAVRADREATASGRSTGSQVVAIRRPDGTDVYVVVSSSPVEWKDEPATLTRLRSSPDPTATLRHVVTGVFSEISDAVVVTDPAFHVRSWNAAAERLYGWAEREVLGRQVEDVVPSVGGADELPVALEQLEEDGRWFGEVQQLARDGSIVNVHGSTTLIRDDAGSPMVLVSVNRRAVASPSTTAFPSPETQDEIEIRRGLERDEFEVHYQPVVAFDDLHVLGVEALARWNHPERGILTPAFFMEAAERSGVILELGQVILEKACRQTAEWRRAGFDLELAVNLSTRELAAPTLYEDITTSLAGAELDPRALWLEVTETSLVEDADLAADLLQRLATAGIRVAIDDFGTGWASLIYLKQFPVHALKIDYLFVDGIDHDPQDSAIARSIISLGDELDLLVVAEGVETRAQQSALQSLGCSVGQGYLFGKPTPVGEVPVDRAHRILV